MATPSYTDKVRVNLYFPRDLTDRVDTYAKEHSLSRNSAVVYILSSYLDSIDNVGKLKDIMTLYADKDLMSKLLGGSDK